ncbi:hypothetical protein LOK49_LG01G02367 [Camellia lanceoleosa]|uniref:Uncharacterized protein n=1 Tax=Camellia lanceoleosa TaxID=1840588 RepID=A0ACC0J008_9ERIC|nr:hypothetical protein LOK49_LG01G02367 [Camellia lanceoleosa]
MEHGSSPARRPEDGTRTKGYSTVTNQQNDQEEGDDAEQSPEEEDLLERHLRKKGNTLVSNVSASRSSREALSSPLSLKDCLESSILLPNDMVEVDSNTPTTIPSISLSKEEIIRIRDPWQNSLIVKLMGQSLGYTYLIDKLKSIWKSSGTFLGINLGNHFFLLKFQEMLELNKVLNEGPWFVARTFLAIRH